MRLSNPLSFTPKPVTIITTVTYLAVFTILLVVHETVPAAPKSATPISGINITEAWLDLQELSNGFHPFNSRRNDEVRTWLLQRVGEILDSNHAGWKAEGARGPARQNAGENMVVKPFMDSDAQVVSSTMQDEVDASAATAAVVFNDVVSNFTSNSVTSIFGSEQKVGLSTYFEGNNIVVYIRGTEDEDGEWWNPASYKADVTYGKGGVMVNAHFDSVSTGYGATDDGVGVITLLQLLRFFTEGSHTPKKGIVLLFNNGEEDGLYGAKAFLSHPMASFVHTFLNLEGAGAGGRATLFRSTDTEVTQAYATAPHPFGTVACSDLFSTGFIRSQTDYVVFQAEGFRGLDVSFWRPRSQYHTNHDSTKYTSKDSLWHMLSASISTVKSLSSDTSDTFEGPRGDRAKAKVKNGKGSVGVWFDLFGETLAVFHLRNLFAWSLALLIASPLVLIIISYILARQEKYYLFSGSVESDIDGEDPIPIGGWKGTFRFPVAIVISSALTIGAAFLITKFNPFIIFSSSYSVWAMSMSLFYISFWFLISGCDFIRPSALHREYTLLWLFVIGWAALVLATIYEDRFKITSGYLIVIYESAIFVAALIGLLEMFALPTKSSVVETAREDNEIQEGIDALPHGDALLSPSNGDDEDATETTPLVGDGEHRRSIGTTFADRYRRSTAATSEIDHAHDDDNDDKSHPFDGEQAWSAKMPSWTWVLQFLVLGPFILVILGQVALLLVTAIDQTGTDGVSLLIPYLILAFFTILLLLPMTPFMHRITHHIPSFLFLVFIGTLIYNLVAFPFSPNNRYKAYFQQIVDLDSGTNTVTFTGVETHIKDIISQIPSATGQDVACTSKHALRQGLSSCSYIGLAPNVVNTVPTGAPPELGFTKWLTYNVTRTPDENKARFHIKGAETRNCAIRFESPVSAFHVKDAATHGKFGGDDVPESGSGQIKLWSRDWDHEWIVDVEWPVSDGKKAGDEGIEGRVVCVWSDFNTPGLIPALDEAVRFAPAWASVSKSSEGLVEGSKPFIV